MKNIFICGNWKMNNNLEETSSFISDLKKLNIPTNVEVGIAPVFTSLASAKLSLNNSNIKLCAQNVHFKDSGAFTGEISPTMLKEIDLDYVIIGHSERRTYFAETNESINLKIKACLKHNLNVIFCIGETLDQREQNKTFDVLETQLKQGLVDLTSDNLQHITIAYEPVWAIGTGKTASQAEASEAHQFIRNFINSNFSHSTIRILYGGSVNPDNVKTLMNDDQIDGALVGGASLKVDSFDKLINF